MNIKKTKKFFDANEIVALKADKSKSNDVIEQLIELGNTETAIPYYAIYAPGLDKPITKGGPILSGWVIDSLEEAMGESADKTKTASKENQTQKM